LKQFYHFIALIINWMASQIANSSLFYELKISNGINLSKCYQCGKCGAGCPLINEMDLTPNQIIRMVQVGNPKYDKQVLSSLSIWLCLTCHTCSTRCPQEVDFPAVLDFMREESLRRGLVNKKARKILAFHHSFNNLIRRNGRLFEVGLIADYKFRSFDLFKDLRLAPTMLFKHKLNLMPFKIKGLKSFQKLFKKESI
jgi:heterodisulfide reductase subunit C2